MFSLRRSNHSPLIVPNRNHNWERLSTCNGCPLREKGTTYVVYRAIAESDKMIGTDFHLSTIGITKTRDGDHFNEHRQLIKPEHKWEKYGCEDPRITKIGGKYYIFYTALSEFPFNAGGIKVAVAIMDDLNGEIQEKHPVTPFNAKAMVLFPEKINGKLTAILTVNTDMPPSHIAIRQFDKEEDIWNKKLWNKWYSELDKHTVAFMPNSSDHVEVGAVPLKTKHGWLFIYSHIKDYFSSNKVFGIQAALLDLEDPKKILCHTTSPLMIPEESYEHYGYVSNVIFPTGSMMFNDRLYIYYGASDTTTCRASVPLNNLLDAIRPETRMKGVKRPKNNPILKPIKEHSWESRNVLNPAAIDIGGTVYIVYRAMSDDNTSSLGLALSSDGIHIDERLNEPIYVPRADFEMKKGSPTGNSGCEDPRITQMGNTLYIFYTAYNGVNSPQVAESHISVTDFLARKWHTWSEPTLITPHGVDDKDACLLSDKVKGKFVVLHRVSSHLCMDYLNSRSFKTEKVDTCIDIFGPRPGMWDGSKVGIAAPPLLTDKGWLLLYHGVSHDNVYRLGVVLLKKNNPSSIIARTSDAIFEPQEKWEKEGEIPNVVFPCGAINRGNDVFIYYGGADRVIGVATTTLDYLFKILS